MQPPRQAVWEARYRSLGDQPLPEPAEVLRAHEYLLPSRGRALDLACGLGGNALFLANHGLETWAWDTAPNAIEFLQEQARRLNLPIQAERRDVVADPPEANRFDVIVVSRFLERALFGALIAALKPGGLLYYQTFTQIKVRQGGPTNPDYCLADNELLKLCESLRIRGYCENADVGDLARGLRNMAWIVAAKPAS